MKKILLGLGVLLVGFCVGLYQIPSSSTVKATPACTPVDKYVERSSDSSGDVVHFDFTDSDHRVIITADAGYTITEVWLDVKDDNHSGYHKYGENGGSYNPNPGKEINSAKVRVIKTCPSPSPTSTPAPTSTPTPTEAPQCKVLNAECDINASGKECCDGLVCVLFNEQSGNHKCQYPAESPTPTPTQEPENRYEWSEWSECSVECGGGIQTRECLPVKGEDDNFLSRAIKPLCENDDEGGAERVCNTQSCEEPTGEPTATPKPEEPTATPGPVSTRWSSLGYNATCANSDIEVTFDTKREDGTFEEKVKVNFEYQGTKKTAETNTSGRATVMYGKNGDGAVTAVADGYPSQSTHMIMPTGCPAVGGQVLGATTGQVLGTTSYAATGNDAQSIFTVAQLLGMLLIATGTARYVKASLKA